MGGLQLIGCYVLALLIMHAYYSTVTYLHHTHPDACGWSFDGSHAREACTQDIVLPLPISWLIHFIDFHTIHHANPKFPFHELALKSREQNQSVQKVSPFEIFRVIRTCHMIDPQSGNYVTFASRSSK